MNLNLTPLQLVLIAIVIMFLCFLLKHLVEADISPRCDQRITKLAQKGCNETADIDTCLECFTMNAKSACGDIPADDDNEVNQKIQGLCQKQHPKTPPPSPKPSPSGPTPPPPSPKPSPSGPTPPPPSPKPSPSGPTPPPPSPTSNTCDTITCDEGYINKTNIDDIECKNQCTQNDCCDIDVKNLLPCEGSFTIYGCPTSPIHGRSGNVIMYYARAEGITDKESNVFVQCPAKNVPDSDNTHFCKYPFL